MNAKTNQERTRIYMNVEKSFEFHKKQNQNQAPVKIKLAIFNCDSRGMFQIHAADCADCAKQSKSNKKHHGLPLGYNIEEHDSALSVSRSIWSDMINEGSMTAEDGLAELDFAPCVKFS